MISMLHVMHKTETDSVKDRLKSSWTPLTDTQMNAKIFEERRTLLISWFSKWSEYQRKQIFLDLLPLCTEKQLEYVEGVLQDKVPKHNVDFTRTLPRVLSLYIFSFLDPRSLCRCAQVCWYWRYLAETNELWAPKCLRRGWILNDTYRSSEQGIWKRHYVQNMRFLQVAAPMKATALELMKQLEEAHKEARLQAELDRKRQKEELRSRQKQLRLLEAERQTQTTQKLVPWRGPTRNPAETVRLNYFDNRIMGREDTRNTEQRRNQSADTIRNDVNNQAESEAFRPAYLGKTTVQHKRQAQVNPRIAAPKAPWRPSSRNPTRRPSADKDNEVRRQFTDVRAYMHHLSGSVGRVRPHSALNIIERGKSSGQDVDFGTLVRPMSVQNGSRDSLVVPRIKGISESDIKFEDLPPPPSYIGETIEELEYGYRHSHRFVPSPTEEAQHQQQQEQQTRTPSPLPPPPASPIMQEEQRNHSVKYPSLRSQTLDEARPSKLHEVYSVHKQSSSQEIGTLTVSPSEPQSQSEKEKQPDDFSAYQKLPLTRPEQPKDDCCSPNDMRPIEAPVLSSTRDYPSVVPEPKPRKVVALGTHTAEETDAEAERHKEHDVVCTVVGDTPKLPSPRNHPIDKTNPLVDN